MIAHLGEIYAELTQIVKQFGAQTRSFFNGILSIYSKQVKFSWCRVSDKIFGGVDFIVYKTELESHDQTIQETFK